MQGCRLDSRRSYELRNPWVRNLSWTLNEIQQRVPDVNEWGLCQTNCTNVWSARLSFYVGTWVLIVVVFDDQLCSGETGSLSKIESGPYTYIQTYMRTKIDKFLHTYLHRCKHKCTYKNILNGPILENETGFFTH